MDFRTNIDISSQRKTSLTGTDFTNLLSHLNQLATEVSEGFSFTSIKEKISWVVDLYENGISCQVQLIYPVLLAEGTQVWLGWRGFQNTQYCTQLLALAPRFQITLTEDTGNPLTIQFDTRGHFDENAICQTTDNTEYHDISEFAKKIVEHLDVTRAKIHEQVYC